VINNQLRQMLGQPILIMSASVVVHSPCTVATTTSLRMSIPQPHDTTCLKYKHYETKSKENETNFIGYLNYKAYLCI